MDGCEKGVRLRVGDSIGMFFPHSTAGTIDFDSKEKQPDHHHSP
jgi:hypothetical protein